MIGFLDFIYKLGLGAALGIVAAQYIGDIDGLGDFLAIFSLGIARSGAAAGG
ncbi:MAG: hypothetical protein IPN50_05365 [Sphingomonadales bacterium]|nr:hypothetical protein [Sphingomonadales bacterium]